MIRLVDPTISRGESQLLRIFPPEETIKIPDKLAVHTNEEVLVNFLEELRVVR